jgi:signal peptidase II
MMLARGLAVAVAAAALDQLSKFALLRHFDQAGCSVRQQFVTPFLQLVLTCNSGVSFGLFNRTGAGVGAAVFAVIAALVVVVLVFWLSRVRSGFLAVAIGLIIGGAIGNVIDRLRFGAVIDFLYFHAGAWYWPAFNLADSAICVGAAALLVDGLLLRRQPPPPQSNRGEDVAP